MTGHGVKEIVPVLPALLIVVLLIGNFMAPGDITVPLGTVHREVA